MPIPDTQKLKLELQSWLEEIDRHVPERETPAFTAGRKLLEAILTFERLARPDGRRFGAVYPASGPKRNFGS